MKKIPVIISFDVHSHVYKDKLNELPFWFENTLKILDNNTIKSTFFSQLNVQNYFLMTYE